MSIRSSVPQPVHRLVRDAYVRLGTLTASSRLKPTFLLVGGQRCGTTSLFRALEQHPDVVRPTFNKGINYFDLNYERSEDWYRAHFPLASTIRRRGSANSRLETFEASGYYIFHPLAPARIARDLPGVKIVAMLRDPVERAYSAWKHESARGFDPMSFEQAIEEESQRTRGERERLRAEPGYQSFAYRHYSYVARGDYVAQLHSFLDHMPSSHLHVVYSESFFVTPEREFAMLADFLGIGAVAGLRFDQHNARPSGPMPGQSREKLTAAFEGQADELEALVGRRPPWAER